MSSMARLGLGGGGETVEPGKVARGPRSSLNMAVEHGIPYPKRESGGLHRSS